MSFSMLRGMWLDVHLIIHRVYWLLKGKWERVGGMERKGKLKGVEGRRREGGEVGERYRERGEEGEKGK